MCSVLHDENDEEKEQIRARKRYDQEKGHLPLSKCPEDDKNLTHFDSDEKKVQKGGSGSAENINLRAAMLHVLGDMVQSVGVVIAAFIIKFKVRGAALRVFFYRLLFFLLIPSLTLSHNTHTNTHTNTHKHTYKHTQTNTHKHTHTHTHTHTHAHTHKSQPDWKLADPACTFLFSVLVLFSTVNILRDAILVLMEGEFEVHAPALLATMLNLLYLVRMYIGQEQHRNFDYKCSLSQ